MCVLRVLYSLGSCLVCVDRGTGFSLQASWLSQIWSRAQCAMQGSSTRGRTPGEDEMFEGGVRTDRLGIG